MLSCKYLPCSDTYMKGDNLNGTQPGVPLSKNKPLPGPYGTGVSGPSWGMCPTGRDWLYEHSGDIQNGTDWILAPPKAAKGRDASTEVISNLARKKINAFFGVGHGFYFWNFRTELEQPHWDYMDAVGRGWIPAGSFNIPEVTTACHREDAGSFVCTLNPYAAVEEIRGAVSYCMYLENKDQKWLANATDEELETEGPDLINECWRNNRLAGVICDFGGIATLVADAEDSDDEFQDTFETYEYGYKARSPAFYVILSIIPFVAGILIAWALFVLSMKKNKRFNVAVRNMSIFKSTRNADIFTGRYSMLGSDQMPMIFEGDDSDEDENEGSRLMT